MLLDYRFMSNVISRKGITMPIQGAMQVVPFGFGKLEIYKLEEEEYQFVLRLAACPDGRWEHPEGESLVLNLQSGRLSTDCVELVPRRWGPHLMLLSGTGWYPAGTQSIIECVAQATKQEKVLSH